jgi:hypothetical protein
MRIGYGNSALDWTHPVCLIFITIESIIILSGKEKLAPVIGWVKDFSGTIIRIIGVLEIVEHI